MQTFPDGILPIGQYIFNFSATLPDWLPSSFVFRRNWPDQAHMRLKYKAVAKMKDCTGAKPPLHPMFAKRPLMVTANALKSMSLNRKATLEKNIKTVFFVKQGLSKMEVNF